MSTHRCWTAWKLPIGWSNCLRTFAYSTASFITASAAPRASAARAIMTSSTSASIASAGASASRLTGHTVEFDVEQFPRRIDVGPCRHGDAVGSRVDGVQAGAGRFLGEHQQHGRRGGIGQGGDLAAQRRAIGDGPRTAQRTDRGYRRTASDFSEQPVVRTGPCQGSRRGDRTRQPRPGIERGAQLLGDDAGLDHRHARAVVVLGDEHSRRTETCQAMPHDRRWCPLDRPAWAAHGLPHLPFRRGIAARCRAARPVRR